MFARVLLDGCFANKAEVIGSTTAVGTVQRRGRRGHEGIAGVTEAKRNDLSASRKKTRCGLAASGKALPSF